MTSGWFVYVTVMTLNGTEYLQVDHLGLDVMPLEVNVESARLFDGDNKLGNNYNNCFISMFNDVKSFFRLFRKAKLMKIRIKGPGGRRFRTQTWQNGQHSWI